LWGQEDMLGMMRNLASSLSRGSRRKRPHPVDLRETNSGFISGLEPYSANSPSSARSKITTATDSAVVHGVEAMPTNTDATPSSRTFTDSIPSPSSLALHDGQVR
jgi:hypothetical protein